MTGVALPVPEDEISESYKSTWTLRALKPVHRQICSMIAQGIPRYTIAEACQVAPEYVSNLIRQPIIREEIRRFAEFAELQLDAQFTKVVDAIGDTLDNGNNKERMMAARLQLEATKRIGPRSEERGNPGNTEDKLINLANRLVGLLENKMATAEVIQDDSEVQDADYSFRQIPSERTSEREQEPTQRTSHGSEDS